MKSLKDLVSISPLLVGFLVFLGMLKLTLYYGYFGFQITQYLQLSEVLTSFMVDLNLIIVMLLTLFIQAIISVRFNENSKGGEIRSLRAISKLKNSIFWFIFSLLLLIGFYFIFLRHPSIFWVYLISLVTFNPVFFLVTKIFRQRLPKGNWDSYLLIICLAVVFTFNLTVRQILIIEDEVQTISITTKEKTILLSSSERLIGKTTDFIFIKNLGTNEKIIIPVNEVKGIVFK